MNVPVDPREPADDISGESSDSIPEEMAGADTVDDLSTVLPPTLEEQLATALVEKAELWDRCLRMQAELENFRKRVNRERDEDRKYAALPLVRDLVPTLDNLQRAVDACRKSNPEEGSPAAGLLQGVEMVRGQLVDALKEHGATPIEALGQPFDPRLHEALQQVPTDEFPPMTVLMEYERGYAMRDRIVRPAKVIVSVAPPAPAVE